MYADNAVAFTHTKKKPTGGLTDSNMSDSSPQLGQGFMSIAQHKENCLHGIF